MRSRRYLIPILTLITLLLLVLPVQPAPAPVQAQQGQGIAPTYTIFATREGLVGQGTANGHTIQPNDRFVALPSPTVLCSYRGYEYQVRVTYKGRSVVVPVWDVGPWNIADDYWSPNRRYSDLPVGVPMAQAAYLENYNGGLDEFGRTILLPNGIDIADGTFLIDLAMTKDDWVQVSFLWLGEDHGPGNAANILPPPTDGQQEVPSDMVYYPDPPGGTAPVDDDNMTGAPLDDPQVEDGAIAVDNSDESFSASDATWYTANCGLNGEHAWTYSTDDPAQAKNHAIWRPSVPEGYYEVKAYIPPCGRTAATRSALYRVTHNGTVTEVTIDQEAANGTWVSLGAYDFGGDGAQLVELSDRTDDTHQSVRFDAITWVPAGDSIPPESRITAITTDDGGWTIEWGGTDNLSGIVAYDVQVRQLPNGGWRDWVVDGENTAAWFGPSEGKHFAFRVRAWDKAGNQESWPEKADMDTTRAEP